MMTDKPNDPNKNVSDFTETRRWSAQLQCWLYPTWSWDGKKRIWVTIPE